MIVPVMAISNLVLTQQIYSEETNGAHAPYREPVPLVKDLSYSKKISGICLSSFRRALPAYLDDDLERLQRRALRISFTLPCLMLKPSAQQDYLHYLKEEKKSPRNSSSRSLQTSDTNYILFCHANPGNSPLDPKQCSTIKERFNSK